MDNEIIVSIIIPIYNAEKHLRQCLDSIFIEQNRTEMIEVIAVNDASTDRSLDILKQYEKYNVIIINNSGNGGTSFSRNIGIKAAKGKYILFMDNDDFYLPGALDNIIQNLVKSKIDIFQFDYMNYDEQTEQFSKNKHKNITNIGENSGQNSFVLWCRNGLYSPFVWIKAVSREMILKNSIYFLEGGCHEDEEWSPRIFAFAHSAKLIPVCAYVYRVNQTTSIMSKYTSKHCHDLLKVIESLEHFSERNITTAEYLIEFRRLLAFLYFYAIDKIKVSGSYDAYAVKFLYNKLYLLKYSNKIKRRTLYYFLINYIGIINFYRIKYGMRDIYRSVVN